MFPKITLYFPSADNGVTLVRVIFREAMVAFGFAAKKNKKMAELEICDLARTPVLCTFHSGPVRRRELQR